MRQDLLLSICALCLGLAASCLHSTKAVSCDTMVPRDPWGETWVYTEPACMFSLGMPGCNPGQWRCCPVTLGSLTPCGLGISSCFCSQSLRQATENSQVPLETGPFACLPAGWAWGGKCTARGYLGTSPPSPCPGHKLTWRVGALSGM